MKNFLIGMLGLVLFVGVFYIITLGQHHEHVRAGAQFEMFYDETSLQAENVYRTFFSCAQDVRIAFDADILRVNIFFDAESYAVVDMDHHVEIPGGVQYKNIEDSFTINDDGTAFLIVEGRRIASQCTKEG